MGAKPSFKLWLTNCDSGLNCAALDLFTRYYGISAGYKNRIDRLSEHQPQQRCVHDVQAGATWTVRPAV